VSGSERPQIIVKRVPLSNP